MTLTKPTILLTGFEPFGGIQTNPAQQIAEALNGETIGGAHVTGMTLPVAFGEDTARAFAAIAELRPALVLCLGLYEGADCLEVERFAVNLKAESGNSAQTPIIADGFAALFSTIDAEHVAQAIRTQNVPARAHCYAGSYLCNHIFYQALHYAQQWNLGYRAGFIHLPLSSEQALGEQRAHKPSLPLNAMIVGIRAALEAATHGP